MIHYRNDEYTYKFLFQLYGSVLTSAVWPALLSAGVSVILLQPAWVIPKPAVEHPFGVQIFALILGYVLVFRTNMALSRYFEGMESLQQMSSKWMDAALQFVAFTNAGCSKFLREDPKTAKNILECRMKVLHWLSLMHALSIMRINDFPIEYDALTCIEFPKKDGVVCASRLSMCTGFESVITPTPLLRDAGGLRILGYITQEEQDALQDCRDPVQVLCHWVCQLVARMRIDGWIRVHPAIVSRIFEELSTGSLGSAQAVKLATIPFPFPFAQMLALLLMAFAILFPMMVSYLTDHWVVAPCFSFIGVLGLWSLNDLAVELEMPFGDDPNDLPLVDVHNLFVNGLTGIYLANSDMLLNPGEVPGYTEPTPMTQLTDRLNMELARMGKSVRFAAQMTDDDYRACTQQLLEADVGFDASVVLYKEITQALAGSLERARSVAGAAAQNTLSKKGPGPGRPLSSVPGRSM